MDFLIRTKHLLVLLCAIAVLALMGTYISTTSVGQTAVAAHSFVSDSEVHSIAVSTLTVRPSVSDRTVTRERIAREIKNVPVSAPAMPQPAPIEESSPSTDIPAEDTDGSLTIAPSVQFCTERTDRVRETFSPQGEVTVSRAEGARIITRVVLDAGVIETLTMQVPELPVVTGVEQCIDSTVVGVGLDGRLMYAGIPFTSTREGLVGYARDGFGIFAQEEDGGLVTARDLDACHGHSHAVVWDGTVRELFHYHITDDTPFTLGCYRGTPVDE